MPTEAVCALVVTTVHDTLNLIFSDPQHVLVVRGSRNAQKNECGVCAAAIVCVVSVCGRETRRAHDRRNVRAIDSACAKQNRRVRDVCGVFVTVTVCV